MPGALGTHFNDRPTPFDDFNRATDALVGAPDVPLAIRYFGGAGLAHMQKYGTTLETFAKIRAKASRHAANNPLALFREEVSVDEVLASPVLMPGVMTRLMACPPTCGAAAAVLVSDEFARRHHLDTHGRDRGAGDDHRHAGHVRRARHDAARRLRHDAGGGAAGLRGGRHRPRGRRRRRAARLLRAERAHHLRGARALPEGGAEKFVADGDNTYGGRFVTNPSGGLLSKGHPLGATGLAQCYELTQQLRGTADKRQVDGARIGLQHNLGLGGACVVTLYRGAMTRRRADGRRHAASAATVRAAFGRRRSRARLRLFAKATGETRPEYLDEAAARAAGHPGAAGAADVRRVPLPRRARSVRVAARSRHRPRARAARRAELPLLRADLRGRPADVRLADRGRLPEEEAAR